MIPSCRHSWVEEALQVQEQERARDAERDPEWVSGHSPDHCVTHPTPELCLVWAAVVKDTPE